MRTAITAYLVFVLSFVTLLSSSGIAKDASKPDDPNAIAWRARTPYEGREVSEAEWQKYSREVPEWFQDAKFGIYAHWGPYNLGIEGSNFTGMNNSWYPKYIYAKGHPYNKHHEKLFGPLSEFGYKDYFARFTIPEFDPVEWADVIADSGAKFAGPVAMHHDGFAMWDSDVVAWNSMNPGAKRDIAGELIHEYRERGLKIVSSFHHAFNVAGNYYGGRVGRLDDGPIQFDSDLNDPAYAKLYGKFATQREAEAYWLEVLKEYITKYQPEQLWFDGGLDRLSEESRFKMTSFYYDFCASKGIKGIISQKKHQLPEEVSIFDFERGGSDQIESRTWQTDDSPGPWMFIEGAEFKRADWVIPLLIDIVSKNGVLLLNIAPLADGSIHPEQQETLRETGEWLRVNGEAIFETRPWKVHAQGEHPNFYPKGKQVAHSGYAEFNAGDLRFTKSKDGTALYVFAMAYPGDQVVVNSLKVSEMQPGATVSLLGTKESISVGRNSNDSIVIDAGKLLAKQQAAHGKPLVFKVDGLSPVE